MRHYLLIGLLLMPVQAVTAEDKGAGLYRQHCAACHGREGRGGVGVPLTLPDFLASVSDAYLTKTIRLGRPGRVMPAFPRLSHDEIKAIIRYLRDRTTQPSTWQQTRLPVKGDARRGKVLYGRHCVSCHGEHGEGGHGTGVTFSRPRGQPIIAPALGNPGFQAAASDALIKTTLLRGRKGTPMTSFLRKGLSEQDIDNIVSYVRTLPTPSATKRTAVFDEEPAILEVTSSRGFEDTVEAVKSAVLGQNYRLIRVQRLAEGLYGPDDKARRMIVYFCNFKQLYEALAIDPRVGLFLPCRVTVVEDKGTVKVMSINPNWLAALFNNAELDQACRGMYQTYMTILEEATL